MTTETSHIHSLSDVSSKKSTECTGFACVCKIGHTVSLTLIHTACNVPSPLYFKSVAIYCITLFCQVCFGKKHKVEAVQPARVDTMNDPQVFSNQGSVTKSLGHPDYSLIAPACGGSVLVNNLSLLMKNAYYATSDSPTAPNLCQF